MFGISWVCGSDSFLLGEHLFSAILLQRQMVVSYRDRGLEPPIGRKRPFAIVLDIMSEVGPMGDGDKTAMKDQDDGFGLAAFLLLSGI